MGSKITRLYFVVTGLVLMVTALAKWVSAAGQAKSLQLADPFFLLPYRYVFIGIGAIEFAIAIYCLVGKRTGVKAILIAFLATDFVIYRLGLWWIDYKQPCGCLGSLTGALHMTPGVEDALMKAVLVYLLVGSYGMLVWMRVQTLSKQVDSRSEGK